MNLFSVENNISINELTVNDDVETASVYEIECLLDK